MSKEKVLEKYPQAYAEMGADDVWSVSTPEAGRTDGLHKLLGLGATEEWAWNHAATGALS